MKRKLYQRQSFTAWCFLLPGLIVLSIFVFYPILFSLPLAFTNYSVIQEADFVGLNNFKRIFNDRDFILALKNSLRYMLTVPIIQILSILTAIILNTQLKGVKFFRTAYYIPVVTSMVAVSLVWGMLLSSDGLINQILLKLNITNQKISWLTQPTTALYTLMFITIWKGVGYYMVIYLAGLQSIPKQLQEAALVDGASHFKQIYYITLPLLRPYIVYCAILSAMGAIRVFDEVFVLTKGSSGTMTLSYFIYKKGFYYFEFGYAAAGGLILSAIILIFSILIFRFNRKGGLNHYD